MAYQDEIPTMADPESVDMYEMYGSDPDYREYWNMLHDSYIGALTRRSSERRRANNKNFDAADDNDNSARAAPVSASTLSPKVQLAFREAQKEIEWRGPESPPMNENFKHGGDDDFGSPINTDSEYDGGGSGVDGIDGIDDDFGSQVNEYDNDFA